MSVNINTVMRLQGIALFKHMGDELKKIEIEQFRNVLLPQWVSVDPDDSSLLQCPDNKITCQLVREVKLSLNLIVVRTLFSESVAAVFSVCVEF